jgi:hypothetical protein|nr:hypothetical protein [Candidatus Krumholzibacteria bacterium]
MKRTHVIVLTILAMAWLVTGAALAADGQKLQWTGVNYTKFLWGNQRLDGSMYNFTTIPGEGGGDNGQATEFELLFQSKPSSKVEVNGRIKSRFNQNHWTNFGGFGGYPGSEFGGTTAGDGGEWDPRSNQYIKLRGITVTITPGYSWLKRATIGSNDFGMYDPFTIGKIRYIDRDNGKGFVFQGNLGDVDYDLTRISLPRLWAGPGYGTGDYNVQDAGYGLKLGYDKVENLDLNYTFAYVSDVEIDSSDWQVNDGTDLTMRQRNAVHGLTADFSLGGFTDVGLQGYYSKYYTHDTFVGMNSGIGTYSAYPVGNVDDVTFLADVDLNDPLGNGLSFNMQYFNIGADYVSVLAARRESDVLLTEGHEAAWFFPQVNNAAWGGGALMGYGGFLGHAQQVATTNVDNEFIDFDEPLAETAIGWKGFTIAPSWGAGNLDLAGEFSYIDYNTNWQMWGDSAYSWGMHPYPTAEPGSGMLSARNAYMPFQEKTTNIFMIKGEYFLEGPEIELHGRFKYVDEEDLRINDDMYVPYNTDGSVNNAETAAHFSDTPGQVWKSFNDKADDDKQMDMMVFEFGAGKQLTDELFADLTFVAYDVDLVDGNSAFQAWNAHTMAGGQHNRNDIILTANYIVGGVEFGGTWQFAFGEYAPDYGDGYTVEYRTKPDGTQQPGFTGRWGRWNSLEKQKFDHRRMKVYMKLNF